MFIRLEAAIRVSQRFAIADIGHDAVDPALRYQHRVAIDIETPPQPDHAHAGGTHAQQER